jgi:hypothetical protein
VNGTQNENNNLLLSNNPMLLHQSKCVISTDQQHFKNRLKGSYWKDNRVRYEVNTITLSTILMRGEEPGGESRMNVASTEKNNREWWDEDDMLSPKHFMIPFFMSLGFDNDLWKKIAILFAPQPFSGGTVFLYALVSSEEKLDLFSLSEYTLIIVCFLNCFKYFKKKWGNETLILFLIITEMISIITDIRIFITDIALFPLR